MNTIKKVSEIAPIDVADYLRITIIDGDDQRMLTNLIEVSKSFIKSYTGLTEEELDNYSDFIIVVLILCQDMWEAIHSSIFVLEISWAEEPGG